MSSHSLFSADLGPNQVCTLFGARSGSSAVSGRDYIKAGYDLDADDLWRRNVLVLLAFLCFFWFTQTIIIEIFPVSTPKVYLQNVDDVTLLPAICRWWWR